MTLHTWCLFVGVSVLLLAVPGPTALVIMRSATTRRVPLLLKVMLAAALGDLTAMVFCDVGLGALLATSASALSVFRVCAGLYLVVIGILSLRRPAPPLGGEKQQDVGCHTFFSVYVVTAFNPKGIAFFAALLPQFIETSGDVAWQLAVLQATFVGLSFVSAGTWAVLGVRLRSIFLESAEGCGTPLRSF